MENQGNNQVTSVPQRKLKRGTFICTLPTCTSDKGKRGTWRRDRSLDDGNSGLCKGCFKNKKNEKLDIFKNKHGGD